MNRTPREVMNEKDSLTDVLAFIFMLIGIGLVYWGVLFGAYVLRTI